MFPDKLLVDSVNGRGRHRRAARQCRSNPGRGEEALSNEILLYLRRHALMMSARALGGGSPKSRQKGVFHNSLTSVHSNFVGVQNSPDIKLN